MATYTKGSDKVQIVIGRPWSLPMTWQTDALPPVAINISGYTFAGTVQWVQSDGNIDSPVAADLTFTTTSASTGQFTVSLLAESTLLIPEGENATVGFTLTDGSGATYDFVIPTTASKPQGPL